MKKTITGFALVAAVLASTVAHATDYTTGTVDKIKKGKITVTHGKIENLGMDAMTMVFVPADDAVAAKLKEGKKIQFVAERIKGKLTITKVK